MQRPLLALCAFLIATTALISGCAENPESTTTQVSKTGTAATDSTPAKTDAATTTATDTAKPTDTTPPAATTAADATSPADTPKDGDEVAVLDTTKGKIVISFLPAVAPKHVDNFKMLAKKKFYDGTRFHRCIAGFMIQGGDPLSKDLSKADMWGTGGNIVNGKEVNVPAEFSSTHHARGIVSMARGGDPNSASSQFFIVTSDSPSLDSQYSAFGKVVSGMDVADQIVTTGDPDPQANGKVDPTKAVVLTSVRIVKWPVK